MKTSEKLLMEGFIEVQQKCEHKKNNLCLKWFKEGFETVKCTEHECPKVPYIKGGEK